MKRIVKVRKPKVTLPETFKEMLEINRWFFLNADEEHASKYADVLSALRGPDNCNQTGKWATTCLIRRAFLGDHYYESNQNGWEIIDQDNKVHLKTRKNLKESHFSRHAQFAFDALELDWNDVNDLAKESK